MLKILLCDDESSIRNHVSSALRGAFDVVATDGPAGLARLGCQRFDVVVTDLCMPQVDGYSILEKMNRQFPDTPVIILTGMTDLTYAVRALRGGARDYIVKPYTTRELTDAIERVLARPATPSRPPTAEADPLAWRDRYVPAMLGASSAMQELFCWLERASAHDFPVVLHGETGTGKERSARAIHDASPRRAGPYEVVDCGALSSTVIESELFGHERGAFTSAIGASPGAFERAHGGTLFLDEIGELPLEVQPKLLRALSEGEVRRVGGQRARKVDIRVIAASHRDLGAEVVARRFRLDLYHRLVGCEIELPPLRERRGDVRLLVDALVPTLAAKCNRPPVRFTERALEAFEGYTWPGNVRELHKVLQGLLCMRGESVLDAEHLPRVIREATVRAQPAGDSDESLRALLERVESDRIRAVLQEVDGNRTRAARKLRIPRPTLIEKIKRLGLDDPDDDPSDPDDN